MRIRSVVPVVAALLLTGSQTFAATHGPNEFSVQGSWSNTKVSGSDDSESEVDLSAGYGRFVSDKFEIGANLGVTKHENVDTFGSFGLFLNYHFGSEEAMTVPYIGAGAAIGFGLDDRFGDNPLIVGGQLGIKHFLGENGAVILAAFLDREMYDEDKTGYSGITRYGIALGIALYK